MDQAPLQISNSAVISMLGGVISILGAAVVSLIIYSFRQSVNILQKSINEVCDKIQSLFAAHDRQAAQISQLDRELASLRAEHAVIMKHHCKMPEQASTEGKKK